MRICEPGEHWVEKALYEADRVYELEQKSHT